MEVLKSQWREQKAFDHEEHPISQKLTRDYLYSEFFLKKKKKAVFQ